MKFYNVTIRTGVAATSSVEYELIVERFYYFVSCAVLTKRE
jgi:hypothetical protein